MERPMIEKKPPHEEQRVTFGVPLVRLVKRKAKEVPELAILTQPRTVIAEKFRRLKTMIVNHADPMQVVVVSSPLPGDGKSLVAMNLALSFAADLDGEILIIDADLRRPSVEDWIEPAPKLGLSEILTDKTSLEHCLISLDNSRLRVLPAGAPMREPLELLTSPQAQDLMRELRQRFKFIIVDTPPIVPFADADAIGKMCDGLLMVIRSEQTTRSLYKQALTSIRSMPVFATILNDSAPNLADRERQYSKYYYAYYDQERK